MIEPDESTVVKVHSGGPRRVTVPAGWWGHEEGAPRTWKSRGCDGRGGSLQRHFQSRSGVRAACQSLYSTRQQVVRKSDPLWGSSLAFLTPRLPCGWPPSHSSPHYLGVHYLSHSAKPSFPHLLPATVKYVQPVLGFTDTAVKAFWRQPCRRRQKVPWTRWVWNAPDRVSSERPASRTIGPDALQNLFPALDLRDTTSSALVPPDGPFAITLQVNRTRVHLQAHTQTQIFSRVLFGLCQSSDELSHLPWWSGQSKETNSCQFKSDLVCDLKT